MADNTFFPIPQGQYNGVIVINAFAILSAAALVSVALKIIWLAIRKLWNPDAAESQEYVFFRTQLGNYAACLLVGNTMNSVAGLMGLPSLLHKGITDGGLCRSQALIMQVGNWATAYFTVSIAIHTFNSLVLKKKQSIFISLPTMIIGWVVAIIAGIAPLEIHVPDGDIYGVAGLTCGVRSEFPKLQFFLHLLPIFIASFLSALLYSLIYLVLRGTLKIKGGIKLTLDPKGRWDGDMESYHRFIARVARSMIWYPITYIALLVPYSVMRLLGISGFKIPFEALVFAFVCWFLLGVLNVLLLYNTFRVLGPAIDGRSSTNSNRLTMDSFGPTGYATENHDEEKRPVLRLETDQYRFSAPFHKMPTDHWHSKSSSQASDTSLLQAFYHERSASGNSISSLSRPITPGGELQKTFHRPAPDTSVASVLRSDLSVDTSPRSLPAPPRHPPLAIPLEGARPPMMPPAIHQPPTTSGQWAPHQMSASGSTNQSTFNPPPLSAVNPTFTKSGPRPLLLITRTRSSSLSPNRASQSTDSSTGSQSQQTLLRSRSTPAVRLPPSSYRPPPVPHAF